MKLYIIWNKKDDRPALNSRNYANILAYLTIEQAQAHEYDSKLIEDRSNFIIQEVEVLLK